MDMAKRRMLMISVLTLLIGFLGMGRAPKRMRYSIVFTQEPIGAKVTKQIFPVQRPDGCRIVSLAPDGNLSVLTPGFVSACDPCVSYDGTRILFAGKRTREENWNIWEMNVDGSGKVQVTKNLGNCFEPLYLAKASVTPPKFDDKVRWITFISTAAGVLDEQGKGVATSLYVMSLSPVKGKGTVVWRTTYGLGGDVSPTILQDGRVLFSSRQRGNFALMTITWAGDNINPFYGTDKYPPIKTMACEMPNRTVVFIESDGTSPDRGGRLVRVKLRRPLHTHEVLSKDGGRYQTPHFLPGPVGQTEEFQQEGNKRGELLVSYTSGAESYGIYVFDFQKGRPGRKIYDDPSWDDVDAMPICPHAEPIARIPMLEFASVLDIKGFKGAGQLQCLNVYDSDRPEAAQVKPGEVKWARFVEGVPVRTSGKKVTGNKETGASLSSFHHFSSSHYQGAVDEKWPPPFVKPRIIGEAPVEPDGSFFVNIVGNTPFFIQLLDENKMALQTMRAWTWIRSGSQRGCIGCHEDKELAPENRATQALLKAQPAFVTTPPENRRTVDFRHNVMPIIRQHCVSCHNGEIRRGNLDLSAKPTKYFNCAYEHLLNPDKGKKYVTPGSARNSPLIWRIFGYRTGVQDTTKSVSAYSVSQMPPAMPLSNAEKQTVIEWIDLGAQWDSMPKIDK
ncbi:hypothetical protein B5M50_03190 [candidate division KSB1 bacterium 4484_219]|nr:MAG: hypothetical protein B5M50_03190 [candidate division KSB1 bacterium 4484_219]